MGEQWTWPDPPETPRDVIAAHVRNWGRVMAYNLADQLIADLASRGFGIAKEAFIFEPMLIRMHESE